jgi:hypothetical protein
VKVIVFFCTCIKVGREIGEKKELSIPYFKPTTDDVSTICVDGDAIFNVTIGKRLMMEKKFNITCTHARLKSEKESTYISIYREKEREREMETGAVNRPLLRRMRE